MNPPPFSTNAPAYRDRKTGLIVFGVFTVLLGLCCALFVAFAFVGQAMAAQTASPAAQQGILPAIAVYGTMAVTLVWLGIGSMMARRWARALLLIFSWSWLLMGVFTLVAMAFVMPQMMSTISAGDHSQAPPVGLFIAIMATVIGFLFIILPGVWLFFYRSPHVKATCEALDPVERWTDRCPLPVLALCLWTGLAVPMMVIMPFIYHGVVPAFGSFVTGAAGTAVYLAIAILWAYCTWSIYRLEKRGWWILLVTVLLFAISGFMTYSKHDVIELYQLMGYSDAMIAEIKKFNFLQGNRMAWMSLVGTVPFVGYLLFIRRYLRAA